VLLESAASGRPIISTDRAGCREAIDHGVNGYLVREQDSADLIEKVEQFMQLTYEEKKAMGLKGREKVQREFDRNIVVGRYLDTVAALTAEKNK
jgi:galacturonosyltransferase